MWLVAAAYAGDLPWACPTVTTPEEAEPLDTDAGVDALIDDLEAAARVWWEDDCDWVVTTEGYATTQTCVTSAGAEVTWVDSPDYATGTYDATYETTLIVSPPEGAETWSSITIVVFDGYYGSGAFQGEDRTLTATWTGSVAGGPDDGWAESGSSYDFAGGYSTYANAVATPACAWGWESWNEDYGYVDARVLDGHRFEVEQRLDTCPTSIAYLDHVFFGAVTVDTWALDEADLDGYSVAFGDCDDTDPSVHPCAEEVAFDGIDQDCDGADSYDADGDGHDAASAGGDDCDDTHAGVEPGGHETPGDGVDQDCDGHDDVDADGDGWTADGDNRPADCDDADPDVYPGAPEDPDDGVDSDCQPGREDTAHPEDTATADVPEPPTLPDPAHRCGGADALLLVPLAGLRRRRP